MDKAELTGASGDKPAAEGAQLLAAVMSVPRQSAADLDDAQMARLSRQPLSLISFLAVRQRPATDVKSPAGISQRLILGIQRPDLAQPSRSPRPRSGVPTWARQERPVPTSVRSPAFAFDPSEDDRNEAVDHASPASASGPETLAAWPWLTFPCGLVVLGCLLFAVLR